MDKTLLDYSDYLSFLSSRLRYLSFLLLEHDSGKCIPLFDGFDPSDECLSLISDSLLFLSSDIERVIKTSPSCSFFLGSAPSEAL